MNRKHEQSVIDAFLDYLKQISNQKRNDVVSASLDGQDNLLLADYLFSSATKFLLAEFKYEEQDIKSEKKKNKSHNICLKLENDTTNKYRHDECHYIAWSATKGNGHTIILNKYFDEVCNQSILINTELKNTLPCIDNRLYIDKFVEIFLNNQVGLDFYEFDKYITWLLDSSDPTGSGQIELLIHNNEIHDFKMLKFDSIKNLKKWMDDKSQGKKQLFKPTNSPSNSGGGMKMR